MSDRKPRMLVLLGASYAKGFPDLSTEYATFINKGVSGEQSVEMLGRFRKDVLEVRPDAVIIWGFINDIFRSRRENIASTLEGTRKNLSDMADIAKAHGIEPILATEVTIRERAGLKETVLSWIGRAMGRESYQDYVNRHVLETNQWVREYARKNGLLVLDFQLQLSDARGTRKKEYAVEDGSHISGAGYSVLSRYAAGELDSYYVRTGLRSR